MQFFIHKNCFELFLSAYFLQLESDVYLLLYLNPQLTH